MTRYIPYALSACVRMSVFELNCREQRKNQKIQANKKKKNDIFGTNDVAPLFGIHSISHLKTHKPPSPLLTPSLMNVHSEKWELSA